MRTLLFAIVATLSVAGCSKKTADSDQAPKAEKAQIATVTVDQLDGMLSDKKATPVDANGEGTRKKLGVIPGALLLSDSETFTTSELPPQKSRPLVFYCANTHCGASHEAAEKAIVAGYTNVKVLPAGIAGWVKAGKKTQTI